MSLTNINLPQIPLNNNYGTSAQQIHNYVNPHIHSSQSQNGQSLQSSIVQQNQQNQQNQQQSQSQNGNVQQNNVDQQQTQNIYIQQAQNNQQFPSWSQYPPTLGTGITDPNRQQLQTSANTMISTTHSTPNSYTAEYYGNDDHQQSSLGYGAMSVTSSIINQPHQSIQAVSHIQSALNNLNAPSLVAIQQSMLNNNKNNTINNKENKDKNIINNNNNNNNNFYLAPGSANHGGSYRQTLNPAIYNAYRMSSSTSQSRGSSLSPIPTTTGHRIKQAPVVHVIQECSFRTAGQGQGRNILLPVVDNDDVDDDILQNRKQDRFDKTALYKTELCTNWMLTGSCTYGNKCHFAHGVEDLKPRMRVENYKTQPCCDPAREGCRRCMYGRRCNYCHPGEAIRRPHPTPYYDKDYYNALQRDFGKDNEFPFGIYV